LVVGEPHRGFAGVERWTRDIDEQFVQWSITPHEIREIDDQVIAMVTVRGRVRSSNLALQFPSAGVFDLPGDRVTCVRVYADVHEALKAAGLEK
jgi:limonene-1,2-epoxide hydrolase